MGIRGASVVLSDGTKVEVESSDDDFTGDLDARDQKQLVRQLLSKIRDTYEGPVELAEGSRITLYESSGGSRVLFKRSFFDFFRSPVKKYSEIYVDPSATSLLSSGTVKLFGSHPYSPPSLETLFSQKMPKVLKSHAEEFSKVKGLFRIDVVDEEDATRSWFLKLPEARITKAAPGETPDSTIQVSTSTLRGFLKGSSFPGIPSVTGNGALAKHLGWLLKKYREELI